MWITKILSVVNRLLLRGYSVRIIVDNEEDVEKLREMETSGEMMRVDSWNISVVTAKLTEVHGLMEAFDGCRAMLHTSAFVDLAGFSGYSELEELRRRGSDGDGYKMGDARDWIFERRDEQWRLGFFLRKTTPF